MSVGKHKQIPGLILSCACLIGAPATAEHALIDASRHTLEYAGTNVHTVDLPAGTPVEIVLVPGTDPLKMELTGSFEIGAATRPALTLPASEEYGRFGYAVVRVIDAPLNLRVWSDDPVSPISSYRLQIKTLEPGGAATRTGMLATFPAPASPAAHQSLATAWEDNGEQLLAMRHWFLAGTGHFESHAYDASESALTLALDHAIALEDAEAIAWIYRWISVLQKIRGERDGALDSLCKGLAAISEPTDRDCEPPEADAQFTSPRAALVLANQIGLIHHLGEEGRIAEHWYQSVLDVVNTSYPWQHQFAVTSSNFGGLQYQRGNYSQARELFKSAYDIHVARNAYENQMNMLSNLALVDQKTGRLDRAIENYALAIQLSVDLDLPMSRARIIHRLGTLNRKIGRLPRAEQLARQSLEIFEAANDAPGSLEVQLLLGDILLHSTQYAAAEIVFDRALSSALELADNGSVIQARMRLAEVALASGSIDEAAALAASARSLAIEKELRVQLPGIEILRARIHEAAGDSQLAETTFRRASQLGASSPEDFVGASIGLARVLSERNPNEALGVVYQGKERLTQWRQSAGDPFIDAEIVESASELVEREIAAHMTLFKQTGDKRFLTSALRASDTAQSQILGSLRRSQASDDTTAEKIFREIAALVTKRTSEGNEEYDPELERLQLQLDVAVNAGSRRRFPDEHAWRLPELAADEAVLEFQVSDPQSYAWLLTSDGLSWAMIAGRDELIRLASEAYRNLRTPASRTGDLRELSFALLSEFQGQLDRKTLYVIPDEILHVVPFSALTDPGSNEVLLDSKTIVRMPSLRWMIDFPASAAASRQVLAVGEPLYFQGGEAHSYFGALQPLQWSKVEIDAISAQFGAYEFEALRQGGATRDAFLTASLDSYSIIHIASHGIVDRRFPELSGIVMSTTIDGTSPVNGFVSAREIAALDIGADLVVLSACETGVGRTLAGEGPLSLSWSFLAAGADQVVSSLWAVSDRSTSKLMVEFYRQLTDEGLSPAHALRAAQLQLRESPLTRRPYYWAAFTVTGQPIDNVPTAQLGSQASHR